MGRNRFDRSERLFGKEGQRALRRTHVAVVGVGGLGSHVVQQLALLGVGHLTLIDHEDLAPSNRNRYVGAWHDDPVQGLLKVDVGGRLVQQIDPEIRISKVAEVFPAGPTLDALKDSDCVFGCVDNDGVRFILNEACLAYEKLYFDSASDVPEPGQFGGRVCVVSGEDGCLQCRNVLDQDEVRRFLSPPGIQQNEAAVYGIHPDLLDGAGPSVVSVNGAIASLAVTEFMVAVTGMREPCPHLEYRGRMGVVARINDAPSESCYYCGNVRGQGSVANVERYSML